MEDNEKMELAQKVNSFSSDVDTTKTITESAIEAQRKTAMSVKEAIDLEATKTALEQEENVKMIVQTKGQELLNDAQAKRVEAETARIKKEEEKIQQERQKELANYEKEISGLKKQAEQLKAENDKAQQFFDNHKSILKCIGIREKLGLKAMQWWLAPASVIYAIFQILLLPVTICGFLVEQVMNILGAICEKMKNNAVKMIISILTIVFIVAVVVGCYWLIAHYVR